MFECVATFVSIFDLNIRTIEDIFGTQLRTRRSRPSVWYENPYIGYVLERQGHDCTSAPRSSIRTHARANAVAHDSSRSCGARCTGLAPADRGPSDVRAHGWWGARPSPRRAPSRSRTAT